MIKAVYASLLASLMLIPTVAFAQFGGSSQGLQYTLNPAYNGPIVQDAFWTDRTSAPVDNSALNKVEVGPGDGLAVLAVVLTNRGLSQITATSGDLSLPAGFTSASGTSDALATQSGIVNPGDSFTLFFQLSVSPRASVQLYNATLNLTYAKVVETGQPHQVSLPVPFRVTGRVILDATASEQLAAGTSKAIGITISNIGSAPATAVVAELSPPQQGGTNISSSIGAVGQSTFQVDTIPVGKSVTINPVLYSSNNAGDTLQFATLQVSYQNAYGVKQSKTLAAGIVVLPRAVSSEVLISREGGSGDIITAGQIYNYSFSVTNISDSPLSSVLVTLTTKSDPLRILGDSKWSINNLSAGSKEVLSTSLFAPTSMIGNPATLDVSVNYLSRGQSKSESGSLGSYVEGQISVRAYELGVSNIGGQTNIVGNLLNEGNTLALFTTIEVVNAGGLVSALPPSQYLGDLDQNSPLPFSIPVNISSSAGAGSYPVHLKVTYKDGLRQPHTFDVQQNIDYVPQPTSAQSNQSASPLGSVSPLFIVIGIAVVAAIIAIVMVRRRRGGALKRGFESRKENNIDSVLDGHRVERKTEERK